MTARQIGMSLTAIFAGSLASPLQSHAAGSLLGSAMPSMNRLGSTQGKVLAQPGVFAAATQRSAYPTPSCQPRLQQESIDPANLPIVPVRHDNKFTYFLIDPPASIYSEARSINAQQDIVGFYKTFGDRRSKAFLLHDGIYTSYTVAVAQDLYPLGINDDGVMVGTFTYAGGDGSCHGIVMTKGSYTIYDDPDAANTVISGISNKGDIIGYSTDVTHSIKSFTFRQDEPTLKVVSTGTYLCGINNSDDMAGYYGATEETHQAIKVCGDKVKKVGLGLTSQAFGINDAGDVVGTYSDPHGFLYHNGVNIGFDVPGSDGDVGTQAFGINNNGLVVGVFEDWSRGRDKSQLHGFIAVPR